VIGCGVFVALVASLRAWRRKDEPPKAKGYRDPRTMRDPAEDARQRWLDLQERGK